MFLYRLFGAHSQGPARKGMGRVCSYVVRRPYKTSIQNVASPVLRSVGLYGMILSVLRYQYQHPQISVSDPASSIIYVFPQAVSVRAMPTGHQTCPSYQPFANARSWHQAQNDCSDDSDSPVRGLDKYYAGYAYQPVFPFVTLYLSSRTRLA